MNEPTEQQLLPRIDITEEVITRKKPVQVIHQSDNYQDRAPHPLNMIASANERGASADELGKLFEIYKEYEKFEAEKAYLRDMTACQAEMPAIFRSKKGGKGNYAPFEEMNAAIRPIYTKYGFSLMFTEIVATSTDAMIHLVCDVGHRGGHVRRHEGLYPRDGKGAQGGQIAMSPIQATGSTHSYAKRYLCKDIFNIAETNEDTDGNQPDHTITEEQVDWLKKLLERTGTSGADFLKWAGVERLEDVSQKKYPDARNLLNEKLRRQKEGAEK